MKKSIVLVLAVSMVLLSLGIASAVSPGELGRFQVATQDGGRIVLVDTASGNAWVLSAKEIKGGTSLRWIPIPFVEKKEWPLPGEYRPYSLAPSSLADEWPVD